MAARKIIERMSPLRGAVITGDAINTQQEDTCQVRNHSAARALSRRFPVVLSTLLSFQKPQIGASAMLLPSADF